MSETTVSAEHWLGGLKCPRPNHPFGGWFEMGLGPGSAHTVLLSTQISAATTASVGHLDLGGKRVLFPTAIHMHSQVWAKDPPHPNTGMSRNTRRGAPLPCAPSARVAHLSPGRLRRRIRWIRRLRQIRWIRWIDGHSTNEIISETSIRS